MSRAIAKLNKEIKALEEQKSRLVSQKKAFRARTTFKCQHCEKRSALKSLTALRDHHYISPYSCSGGDYWVFSKEYRVLCPHCNQWNREYHSEYTKEDSAGNERYKLIDSNQDVLKEVLDYHNEQCTLDELRKQLKERKERHEYYW